jgi:hypothetical protein
MAISSHTVEVPAGQPLTIFAETDNINYFINGDLEPDALAGVTNGQVSVGGGSRRQYPGDATTISVAGSTREFIKDPSRSSGTALPGKSFILKEINEEGEGELRQFTYQGRLIDLHAFLSAEAAFEMYLYSNSGARYTIGATVAP